MQNLLRRLPKVDQLLADPQIQALLTRVPRSLVLKAIRTTLENLRLAILDEDSRGEAPDLDRETILSHVVVLVGDLARPHFRRVVNATGVIIHTNLGRSLMADEALAALRMAGGYYSNLEYNLAKGRRGSRYSHIEELLCELTGAEAGLVVNNNAAGVLISLETLARGREVVVSRGELVEIGGAFRIPDVMARSGAVLVEVGTTNKTHLRDYEDAVTDMTALFLKVHQSNFRIVGFTEDVDVATLVSLGRSRGIPVMEDLGSGSLIDLSAYGLRKEPTVQESLAAGADVVAFSGDKLLGGPQAGVILGRKDIIDPIKKNPLNRAIRIDKFTLAALEATLRLYLDREKALTNVPTLNMITMSYQVLRKRAARLKKRLALVAEDRVEIGLVDGYSQIGGGALPDQDLETRLVTLHPLTHSVNRLEQWLRGFSTPIIGRIENEVLVLDVRTMADEDFEVVGQALAGWHENGAGA